jgi:hypothetical protein
VTPHHRYPDVSWQDLRAEIETEIEQRRSTYQRRVEKGMMLRDVADRELAIAEALRDDVDRFRTGAGECRHAFTWRDRHAALTRELELRARYYPEWISKGRITQAVADRRRRILECLRAIYEFGQDWTPSNGAPAPLYRDDGDQARAEARIEWHTLQARLADRDGRAAELDGFLRMIALDDRHAANDVRAMLAPQEELAL